MTVHAHHPGVVPPTAQEPSPAEAPPQRQAAEDHAWLLGLGVLATVVLVFAAMVVLTMLAGGDGYVR
ncbi:hypothetical protein E9549_15225 [Blastococcus sp. MG754426]|uniref:hypothetical protein n=1 Tax=unclassified Blastococcus TaxID=2619396 RepID=UPI001EF007D0|nr:MULTISPECIES: hypothetical protein [unclassified Blastococcus]MCF6508747.1 hypothetical protein [Blastococcus sp. MG754426]MCF6513357.1 hypothetical protein [Blastococcus sp. MG754427]MCF6734577.1 hypothetical protein [Blastococcus sp. KM273129]